VTRRPQRLLNASCGHCDASKSASQPQEASRSRFAATLTLQLRPMSYNNLTSPEADIPAVGAHAQKCEKAIMNVRKRLEQADVE
jgi:hypothetical protein